MITIEIYSQMLDIAYDFVLDENAEIRTVIEDVAQMMSQSDRGEFRGDASELYLYSMTNKTVLSPENTLFDCGIKTGDRLCIM